MEFPCLASPDLPTEFFRCSARSALPFLLVPFMKQVLGTGGWCNNRMNINNRSSPSFLTSDCTSSPARRISSKSTCPFEKRPCARTRAARLWRHIPSFMWVSGERRPCRAECFELRVGKKNNSAPCFQNRSNCQAVCNYEAA